MSTTLSENAPQKTIANLRWLIAGMLFVATVINYVDRQILSVVAPVLRKDLNLSNAEYAHALNAFLTAYAIMYALAGRIIDLLNTRRGLALSFSIWSLASLAHTFVVRLWDLCLYRFLLGTAEPGNFPAAVKGVSAWFPVRERGLAIGFVLGGTGIGAVLAPPLAVWITLRFGWRMAFLLTSLSGMLWLIPWLLVYDEPEKHPWISEKELQHIQEDRDKATHTDEGTLLGWKTLFALPQTWSFILARFFSDPLGYFYWYWIPSYLVFAKGFSFDQLGKSLWIPYLFQDFGQISGGYFSGRLIRRGLTPLLARKWAMSLALLLTPAAILSVKASHTHQVILWVSLATFAIGWWGVNYNSLLMDSVPRHSLASVAGVAGTAGSAGSMIVTWLTGRAADRNAYFLIFWGNTALICLSVASTWLLLRKPFEREAVANPIGGR